MPRIAQELEEMLLALHLKDDQHVRRENEMELFTERLRGCVPMPKLQTQLYSIMILERLTVDITRILHEDSESRPVV